MGRSGLSVAVSWTWPGKWTWKWTWPGPSAWVCWCLWAGLVGPAQSQPQADAARWVNDLSPIEAQQWNPARAAHLLERAGFGGTPAEIAQFTAMTPEADRKSVV